MAAINCCPADDEQRMFIAELMSPLYTVHENTQRYHLLYPQAELGDLSGDG
jgi:hypothetical protein